MQDVAALQRLAAIVRGQSGPRVVVVSALARVTDALLAARDVAALEPLVARHTEIAHRLLDTPTARAILEVLDRVTTRVAGAIVEAGRRGGADDALRDVIAAGGEDWSAPLVAAVLAAQGIPAVYGDPRRCIIPADAHAAATALQPATDLRTAAELAPLLAAGRVPVLGGFVAARTDGTTTTLGRGGSDVTAALVGAALDAREVQIWTDVPGVLTADPRVVPDARTIGRLAYAEAAELAYFGAKVLHPRTIEPAVARGIPVRILDSRSPDGPSTLVAAQTDGRQGTIKAIAHKTGIAVVQITATRMLGTYGFLHGLFEVFARHRTVVDVVTTSEVSVSLTLEQPDPEPDLLADLERLGAVVVERDRAIVCVVGDGLRDAPGIAGTVFDALRDINVDLISQGASQINLTFVVEAARAPEVVRRVHAAVFARSPSEAIPA